MAYEYVFRGDIRPYAPSAEDQRARERSKREADQLVNQVPVRPRDDLSGHAEVTRRVEDYQVGGLNAFGATSTRPTWDAASAEELFPAYMITRKRSRPIAALEGTRSRLSATMR